MNEFVGKGTENGLNLPDSRFKKIYSINPRTDSVLNSNFKPGSPSKGLVGAGGHKRDSTNIFQLHLILLRYFQCHEERGDGGERLAQYFCPLFHFVLKWFHRKRFNLRVTLYAGSCIRCANLAGSRSEPESELLKQLFSINFTCARPRDKNTPDGGDDFERVFLLGPSLTVLFHAQKTKQWRGGKVGANPRGEFLWLE